MGPADLIMPTSAPPPLPGDVVDQIKSLGNEVSALSDHFEALSRAAGLSEGDAVSRLSILHGYMGVFVVAFLVTLVATPIMRRLAVAHGIVDRPSDARKMHRVPIAYLGGVGVFLGLMGGILYSIFGTRIEGMITFHPSPAGYPVDDISGAVPISVILGISVIMMIGLLDDVVGISPRIKVVGQLMAAAALAYQDVGVKVAAGLLLPLAEWIGLPTTHLPGYETIGWLIPLPFAVPGLGASIFVDFVYWTGTAVIAVFVLGGCNASNLIDGLDGLLTGVTGICVAGLLFIALSLALNDDGPRDAQRIVLCMALLGACMGFLPHNFNPATIFLGDCGSLMLGFTTVVIILTLGDTGKTHLVFAGLIIYAIPIIDTSLAIVRRRLAGKAISDPDSNHMHHMLRRAMGVKRAVLSMYAFGLGFALLGVGISLGRARVVYVLALVFAAFIGVTAIKIARREQIEEQASASPRRAISQPSGAAPRERSPSEDEAA